MWGRMRLEYKWSALSCTSLGALIATINGGTLIIALPELARELHAELFSLVWVILGYMLAQTALVLMVGRFADMIGRKKLYVAGFAVFQLKSKEEAIEYAKRFLAVVGEGETEIRQMHDNPAYQK